MTGSTSSSEQTEIQRDLKEVEYELRNWVTDQLKVIHKAPDMRFDWQAISGDAGFRKYFRLHFERSNLLAVFSPPETENNRGFLAIDEFFYSHGVHVPKILAYDLSHGYFLIEDLGEALYLDHLNEDTVNTLYGEALFSLLRIQQCPLDFATFPEYDHARLLTELELFPEWFVRRLLGLDISPGAQKLINETFDVLLESALAQPKVIVHRDFHSRNIVHGLGGSPGIIDFQDAVIGPFTYDLVSLLRDCYVNWPADQVKRWALAYANMAYDAGVIPLVSEEIVLRWFDLMGLQRHLKVLGIFARLSIRDNKHQYLEDLPLVVNYVRDTLKNYSMFANFSTWFDEELLPEFERVCSG